MHFGNGCVTFTDDLPTEKYQAKKSNTFDIALVISGAQVSTQVEPTVTAFSFRI
jgi:hypothetical protein